MRFSRLWWVWLAVGSAATAGYFLLPRGSLTSSLAYNVIGLASGLLILTGVRLHRPEMPGLWYWFAAGQIVWVIGDVVWEYYAYVRHVEPYPSAADVFYLGAYPLLILGLLPLVRGGRGRDLAGLIDAAVVGTGLGLVLWIFVLEPIASDDSVGWTERLISTAYPAADVLLLALLARLYTSSRRTTSSVRLLALATLLLLVADIGYSVVTLYSDGQARSLDALWLMSYVTWAAAALHPSMRISGTDATGTRPAGIGRGRLLLLAACSLIAPAMLFLPGVGDDDADRAAVALGAMVLFLLVVLRMSGFVQQVQRQAGQLEDLAMHDDLTGLANRRRFEQKLRQALGSGPVLVTLLDLDGFKKVNDDLGHALGDRLIVELAGRLRATVCARSTVARMGGDEFAVLVPGAGPAEADHLVDQLAGVLREPVRVGGHQLLVTASFGVTDGTGTDDPFEVLRRADVAMYAAKENGEQRRRYTTELDERASAQASLGAELRTALDTGQFRLVYQPIVALPEGRVVAVEALVRWAHPERGLVNPADFIAVAEQNGLIVELGRWILRTACEQAARWRADHGAAAPEKISVNVSARQLARPGFAEEVADALADSGLPASGLAVEVTETAVFEGGQALETLHELRRLGVRIALDDFGTGHSSLGLLQTVPVDILKVDKSFVDNITMAGRHAVIATALIQVSDGLGLTAVAEGVETREQADELYRLGYRLVQGFHFGRPTAEPDFTRTGQLTA
ncbi:putative bifunctional diguanylate cyclase/phosphodiesterase [Jidongwangia harbinensis]|uniref:putative bifunctional diguanylate cyclase/phosphodiesterase n=1 Tax=Jidongwangia harbinensis TaxID=2878561 RepID=UPI001CD91CF2|nr:bifunctional diguanylate cyclase/phosphodiesterase [Jidongwangia harbinensis]MCA2218943.1 bifunctional diguanylate cyclase/phosphodiesterase [Jidongwangia harbinensis]